MIAVRMTEAEARAIAERIARPHTYCEDCWYSCPLAEDGCCDDSQPSDKCTCGRDAEVERIIAALVEAGKEKVQVRRLMK